MYTKECWTFSSVTETLLKIYIRIGTDHFRNFAKDYPEKQREYSGVYCFLNPRAFTLISSNAEVVIETVLFIAQPRPVFSVSFYFCFLLIQIEVSYWIIIEK